MCRNLSHSGQTAEEKRSFHGSGDESGFAPNLASDEEAIEEILSAVETAGYSGRVKLALDAAGSEWAENGEYRLSRSAERGFPQMS